MAFIHILYLSIFLLQEIKSEYISIPFKVQNYNYSKKSKYYNLINNYLYKDIKVSFLVGNPPQTISLSACLKEFSTFIISKDAKGIHEGIYNKNISNTYMSLSKNNENYAFQVFSEGINSKDNFQIEKSKIKINDLEFILATKIGGNFCFEDFSEFLPQPGILGFKLAQPLYFEENITNTNFISQLKRKNLISGYDFNFHFKSDNSGNIIIGFKPHEYDKIYYKKENYIFIKTSFLGDDLDWSLSFDKIYYGKDELLNRMPILIRIEYGFINGDEEWQKILEFKFFEKLIEENICFKSFTNELDNTLFYYYCNKSADIYKFSPFIFYINEFNYNFSLTYEDLFANIGDKYLFLMTFGGAQNLILGYPFLKKYQLIFNQDAKTIGFYKEIKKEDKTFISYYITIIILGIILLILLIVVIIFYIKKMKNIKKKATELLNEEREIIIE